MKDWFLIMYISLGLSGLFALILNYINDKIKPAKRPIFYDERQKAVQRTAYRNSFIFVLVLLGLAGFLSVLFPEIKIGLTSQNIIIIFAGILYFCAECAMRSASWGINFKKGQFYLLSLLYLIYLIPEFLVLRKVLFEKKDVLKNGDLSAVGWNLVIYTFGALLFGTILLGWYKERKKGREDE